MITNNGKALMYVSDWHEDNSNDPTYTLQRTNGTVADVKRNTTALNKKLGYSYLASNMKIIVGSGDTTPATTDFRLANEITASNLRVIGSESRNHDDCDTDYNIGIIMQASATLKNISTTDTITIKEVGLVTQDDTGASYLLMREVLGSEQYPIIRLAPNETTAITLGVNEGTSGTGFNGNGTALCYINNFGNGVNNKGETNYPKITLSSYQQNSTSISDVYNINLRRSYVNANYATDILFSNSNYQNIINSLSIGAFDTDNYDVEVIDNIISTSSSCRNKQDCNISYQDGTIIQVTKTFKNNDSNSHIITKLKLQARDYVAEKVDSFPQWFTATNRRIDLAEITLASSVTLAPGESVSFTITVG